MHVEVRLTIARRSVGISMVYVGTISFTHPKGYPSPTFSYTAYIEPDGIRLIIGEDNHVYNVYSQAKGETYKSMQKILGELVAFAKEQVEHIAREEYKRMDSLHLLMIALSKQDLLEGRNYTYMVNYTPENRLFEQGLIALLSCTPVSHMPDRQYNEH